MTVKEHLRRANVLFKAAEDACREGDWVKVNAVANLAKTHLVAADMLLEAAEREAEARSETERP